MTARDEAERLLAEKHARLTYSDFPWTCSCDPCTSNAASTFSSHVAQVLDEAGLLAEPQCCCECSPPEFGGSLPDRECPLHAQPAAAPSEDVEALAQQMREWHDGWTDQHEANEEDRAYAEAVLASDWLAAHDAQVRADERRRALVEVEERIDAAHPDDCTGIPCALDAGEVIHILEGMAEAAEADSRPVAAPVSAEQPETAPGAARGRESATGAES